MSAIVKLRLHRPRRLVDTSDRRLVYRAVDLAWPWFFSLLLCLVAYIPARIYAETAGDIAATSATLVWVIVAILAAMPRQMVDTCGRISCMVS